MGCSGSKKATQLEVQPGTLTGAAGKAPSASDEKTYEGTHRSLAGNLMQSHQMGDSLRIEDEYDDTYGYAERTKSFASQRRDSKNAAYKPSSPHQSPTSPIYRPTSPAYRPSTPSSAYSTTP